MKITRKARRVRRVARRTGIAALLAALVSVLGACASAPGTITEIERGENGDKIEWIDPSVTDDDEGEEGAREVYLRHEHGCALDELIQNCAVPADVLVPADQTTTEQGVEPGMFRSCRHAEALNAVPLTKGRPGWNPDLDDDNNGRACEK